MNRLLRWGYCFILACIIPFLLLHLLLKSRSNPDYRKRWGERFGFFPEASDWRTGGLLIHAVSVGELNAAGPVIRHLLHSYPQCSVTITTTTPTASALVTQTYGDSVQHVYMPFDLPWMINRLLRATRARLLLIMEAEIWPNLFCLAAQQMPVAILNARLSAHSARQHQRYHRLARLTMQQVDWVAAQTHTDIERYRASGTRDQALELVGNLKLDLHVDARHRQQASALRQQFSDRPVWLLASSHEGEEAMVLAAFSQLRKQHPELLLVLAPRHPERAARIAQLCQTGGFKLALVSDTSSFTAADDVILVDVLGQLLAWYGAADLAQLGGTLVDIGGHNPVEPVAMGCPLVIGPYRDTIQPLADSLAESGAAQLLDAADQVTAAIGRLLSDSEQRLAMSQSGKQLISRQGGALQRTLEWIDGQLAG